MEIRPTRILLIEDDEDDYLLLTKVLARIPGTHYEVTWEPDYASGLARLRAHPYDASLLDYRLGARNGIELVKEARQMGYQQPIILLTGANEGEIDIKALKAGADDYIAKDQLQGELLHRIIRYSIERKKAEREREKLLSEQIASRELEKKRNEFISLVVHELKTPLTTLKGYAQLMQKRFTTAGDSNMTRMAMRMDTQINKLNGLISDFQDVTRIEGGKLKFNEAFFSFDALVAEIVEDLQMTTQQHILQLEGETGALLWGDPGRIGQVITNLLNNAIKYAPITDRIIVRRTMAENMVQLCVQDFGPGIPQEQQGKIFDPFYRIESSMERAAPGLGLGLYIASEIIRRHEGTIWIESEEGNGSTFCFSLPLQRSNQPSQSDQHSPKEQILG